jgi:methylenetetrahydrofolate dehydrogenase (NADP+)/methenyltetrahydrofolate cyclohydrolase
MIINGREIANEIKEGIRERVFLLSEAPNLIIFQVGDDYASNQFVRIKEKVGEQLGIGTEVVKWSEETDPQIIKDEIIERIAESDKSESAIIQLPLPEGFNQSQLLNLIPKEMDVDVLTTEAFELFTTNSYLFEPPVAGAIREIIERLQIEDSPKVHAVVVGQGKLVGIPVVRYLRKKKFSITVIDEFTDNQSDILKTADIIVSGVGKPGFIGSDDIKEGAILIDAGTSEQAGKVAGDFDPGCYEKARAYTPVPGGVGPLTVAILFENVLRRVIGKVIL